MAKQDEMAHGLAEAVRSGNLPLINRRGFLKKAGLGSLALASLPTLGSGLARTAFAGDLVGYHVLAVSAAKGDPPTAQQPAHWLINVGHGTVHDGQVSGGGRIVHFLNPGPGVPPPFEIFVIATWTPKDLIAWNTIGEYAGIWAGTLDMSVEAKILFAAPGGPGVGDVVPALLKIICNVGPGGLQTGEPEGFTLTIPGVPIGPFEPLQPEVGLTSFTSGG